MTHNEDFKIVYFKIKGHAMLKQGPCLMTDTNDTLTTRFAKVFQVAESDVQILEIC